MSNYLAIAAVTATLVRLLRDPVNVAVTGAEVVADRPSEASVAANGEGAATGAEVRVFLYGVSPNPQWRNADLSTRRPGGELAQRPQVALDLHYLLTFHGDERALEPQRMLGVVVRELHVCPLLDRDSIRRMIERGLENDASFPLETTDLADQPELVRFTPVPMDIDEMSKLWSVFFQTPYRLSVAYQASVVLINPDDTSSPSPPVQERRVFTSTIRRPRIERVLPVDGPATPVTVGTEVRILGSQLRGEETVVLIGVAPITVAPEAIGDREIRATVPPEARAGMAGVRVEHRVVLGDPPPRTAGTSNIASLIVRPRILRDDAGAYRVNLADDVVTNDGLSSGNIEIAVEPPVGARQRVSVVLSRLDAPSVSLGFDDPSRDLPGDEDETGELVVPFHGVSSGTWVVRVVVDGAESPLDRDLDPDSATFERPIAPRVVIP
jgi:hypothetical protein